MGKVPRPVSGLLGLTPSTFLQKLKGHVSVAWAKVRAGLSAAGCWHSLGRSLSTPGRRCQVQISIATS